MKLLSYLGEVWKCLKMEINRKWGVQEKKKEKMIFLMKFLNRNLKLIMSKRITQYTCYQPRVLLCGYHFFVHVSKIKGNMIKSGAIPYLLGAMSSLLRKTVYFPVAIYCILLAIT